MRRYITLVCIAAALAAAVPAEAAPEAVEDPDVTALVRGNTQFALDLYGRLSRMAEGENLFLSPWSISASLGMTCGGARGNTAAQMRQVLHFELERERLHPAFGGLTAGLKPSGEDAGYELHVANALWGQEGVPFRDEYLDLVSKNYGAGLRQLNFAGNPDGSRRTINAWVEEQTRDKIKELLHRPDVTPLTVLVLTNAIYFKGDWASQFDKDRTAPAPFHCAAGKKVNVPMMFQKGKFRYRDAGDVQVLEMPYAGEELSMVLLLPKDVNGLPALERSLSPRKLSEWTRALHEREVHVYVPTFKATSRFELGDVLQEMGMTDAFTGGKADFSGMSPSAREEGWYMSKVIHKAFVDVNEEGTEAAAATAVVVERMAVSVPTVFLADHPFLFLIRDVRTDSILFMGRLATPEE